MNRIFVLKDVAYAAKQGGGVIAGVKEVNLLAQGALAFFTPQGTLLTLANAAVQVADKKAVILASGRELDNQLVGSVPRRLNDINLGNYRAFVKPVISVDAISLGAGDEGDTYIRVSDISYTSKFPVQEINASAYKKLNNTPESIIDRIVAKLNAPDSYVVATKYATGGTQEVSTILVTAAATADGIATVDLNGDTINLPLTDSTIAVNALEIANAIDALDGYSAVSDGVSLVTITATVSANLTDLATYAAGTATTSAATLATTIQGVAGTDFGVDITPKLDGVAIEVTIGGLIEGDPVTKTTKDIHGIGGGAEILVMEKDFSVEEGNGNYIDYTAEWYKRAMEALAGTNYDVISILWQGTHETPTQLRNVMHNRVVIACVDGAGNGQSSVNIMAILAVVFGNAYTVASGFEPAADDGKEHDGVAGN